MRFPAPPTRLPAFRALVLPHFHGQDSCGYMCWPGREASQTGLLPPGRLPPCLREHPAQPYPKQQRNRSPARPHGPTFPSSTPHRPSPSMTVIQLCCRCHRDGHGCARCVKLASLFVHPFSITAHVPFPDPVNPILSTSPRPQSLRRVPTHPRGTTRGSHWASALAIIRQ